jgi:hypothetical protein
VPALLLQRQENAAPSSAARFSPEEGMVDAVYVTRLQKERLPSSSGARIVLPPVDARFLGWPPVRRAIVMHPLPRTREIDPALDGDKRAAYFRQAAAGVPVRMALLLWAFGRLELSGAAPTAPMVFLARAGTCGESTCISVRESLTTPGECVRLPDGSLRCAFCESPWPVAGT